MDYLEPPGETHLNPQRSCVPGWLKTSVGRWVLLCETCGWEWISRACMVTQTVQGTTLRGFVSVMRICLSRAQGIGGMHTMKPPRMLQSVPSPPARCGVCVGFLPRIPSPQPLARTSSMYPALGLIWLQMMPEETSLIAKKPPSGLLEKRFGQRFSLVCGVLCLTLSNFAPPKDKEAKFILW